MRMVYLMASRCWCCVNLQEETMDYFLLCAGIKLEGLTFHQAIVRCWTAHVIPRLQLVLQALSSVIVCELWKRRNNYKYGDVMSVKRVIYQIASTLQNLVQLRKPSLKTVPYNLPDLLNMMEYYIPKLKITNVL